MPFYTFENTHNNEKLDVLARNEDVAREKVARMMSVPVAVLQRVYTNPAGVIFRNNSRDGNRGTSKKSTFRKTE